MSTRTIHDSFDRTWFVTFTCYQWIPLFELFQSYDLVYNWIKLLNTKTLADTQAFVIMPNHVHVLLHLKSSDVNLNTIVSNGKRFMAYELIKRIKAANANDMLKRLEEGCSLKERAKGQLHKVFEPSFDAKPIYTDAFLHQKLDYIHHNPVSGKWNLSVDFTRYVHSSAAFYEKGEAHSEVSIVDWRDVSDE